MIKDKKEIRVGCNHAEGPSKELFQLVVAFAP